MLHHVLSKNNVHSVYVLCTVRTCVDTRMYVCTYVSARHKKYVQDIKRTYKICPVLVRPGSARIGRFPYKNQKQNFVENFGRAKANPPLKIKKLLNQKIEV